MPLIHTPVRSCEDSCETRSQDQVSPRPAPGAPHLVPNSPHPTLGSRRQSRSTAVVPECSGKNLERGPRVPLKLVIVISMCVFTVGPAIALWMVSWHSGNNGISSINDMGQSSVEVSCFPLRYSVWSVACCLSVVYANRLACKDVWRLAG